MKTCFALTIIIIMITSSAAFSAEIRFDDFFKDKTLRIDYYHAGNAESEQIILNQMYIQDKWAGPIHNTDSPINLGKYFYRLYDVKSGKMIYARGFDAYFGEYQTTEKAISGFSRSYQESAILPFPKDSVRFVIEKRDRQQKLIPIYELKIDPADYHIITQPTVGKTEIIPVVTNGEPKDHVDILFLSEGYTEAQRDRFVHDLNRYTDSLFAWEPYHSRKNKFNVTGIFVASADSGIDEPRQGRYRNTIFECTFNSLDSDRYMLTENNKVIRDYAGLVPYDAIFIMANIRRYGGGGIYNTYCTFTNNGPWAEYVFHHEFGHSFAGLADEYFADDDTYQEFYPPGLEPLEANITALSDPANLKWKKFLSPGIEIPTPWDIEEYNKLTAQYGILEKAYEAKKAELKKNNAGELEISQAETEYRENVNDVRKKIADFFENHPLKGKVGAFQGAGYDSKNFYRPTINSIMHRFNRSEKTFYPVNEQAIIETIQYFAE